MGRCAGGLLMAVPLLGALLLAPSPAGAQVLRPEAAAGSEEPLPAELVERLKAASEALRASDWARAESLFATLARENPKLPSARFGHGIALARLGRVREAVASLEAGIGPNPDPTDLASAADLLQGNDSRESPAGVSATGLRKRALLGAVSRGDPRSPDFEKAAVAGQLAAELHDDATLAVAVKTLRQHHPERMETHYLAAADATRRNDWVTAEDEILAAGKAGLPAEQVQRILAMGLHDRATPWRYTTYALFATAAVALGLVILFLVGKILSFLTLRSAERGDPNSAITGGQRRLRQVYRHVINVAGIYYYICLPFVILLSLLLVAALGYSLLSLRHIAGKLAALVLGLGLATLMMAWSSIRSLFVRLGDEAPGRPLTPEEAPALWELTREVAAKVGTRPVDEIWLTPGTELAVFERGGWLRKLRDQGRRALILGAGVLPGFHLDPFRAVLAHEYGHFIHRDTAGGDVALRVRASMHKFAIALIQQGNADWWNLGWQFLRLYDFLFRRITHGASRLQEINADRVAARLYGPTAFEEGLRHVFRRDIARNAEASLAARKMGLLPEQPQGQASAPTMPEDPEARYIRAHVRRQVEAQLAIAWARGTTEDDTHPQPTERIRLVSRVRPVAPIEESTLPTHARPTAEALFADPTKLRAEHAEGLGQAVKAYLENHRGELRGMIDQIDTYLAENPGLVEPIIQRGMAHSELRAFEAAEADFSEALRLDPAEPAACHFQRGVARAGLGKTDEAVADFLEAARLKPDFEAEARVEAGDVLRVAGRAAEAIAEYDRVIALKPDEPDRYLRRADAHVLAGNFAEALADYVRAQELDARCAEALAGQALACASLGRFDEASAHARAALGIDPELTTDEPTLAALAAR